MSSGVVTAVAYLCTLVGLGATAAYALSFYILPYNKLFLEGESGHDERDLPYIIAMIECAISGATFIIGVLAFSSGKPKKRVALIAVLFFIILVIMEGTFGVIRAWNLGFFGDDMEKTCSDTQQFTGCPTTRFEALHHEILYTEPRGGECSFWFWGPEMKTRSQFQCPPGRATCEQDIETYMDWSKHQAYGWRDDPEQIKTLLLGSSDITTVDKVHNMKEIMRLQAQYNSSIVTPLSTQPSIAYCWYWGCNKVCTALRWSVNRWWFISSLTLFVLQIINLLLAIVIYRSKKENDYESSESIQEAKAWAVDSDLETPQISAPVIGRRRRTLNKNPSALRF